MKKLLTALIMATVGLMGWGQEVETFVSGLLHTYPEARLLDVYKSCFQDYMGAEHLVADTASARGYLEQELSSTSAEHLLPWLYEPCGTGGRYVRVSLRAVHEGYISIDELLNAFIASANTPQRPTVDQWAEQWHLIVDEIDDMRLDLKQYEQDKQLIDSVLTQGQYALSHSRNIARPTILITASSSATFSSRKFCLVCLSFVARALLGNTALKTKHPADGDSRGARHVFQFTLGIAN